MHTHNLLSVSATFLKVLKSQRRQNSFLRNISFMNSKTQKVFLKLIFLHIFHPPLSCCSLKPSRERRISASPRCDWCWVFLLIIQVCDDVIAEVGSTHAAGSQDFFFFKDCLIQCHRTVVKQNRAVSSLDSKSLGSSPKGLGTALGRQNHPKARLAPT